MFSWIARVIKGIVITQIYPTWNFWRFQQLFGNLRVNDQLLAHPFKDFAKRMSYTLIPVAPDVARHWFVFYPIEYLLENYQVYVLWSFAELSSVQFQVSLKTLLENLIVIRSTQSGSDHLYPFRCATAQTLLLVHSVPVSLASSQRVLFSAWCLGAWFTRQIYFDFSRSNVNWF